jgi:hypothetical protein
VSAVSILIRSKNEADSIGRLLDILDSQQVEGGVEAILSTRAPTTRPPKLPATGSSD